MVSLKLDCGLPYIYQWNTKQHLLLENLEFPVYVFLAYENETKALRLGTTSGESYSIRIPDSFLQKSGTGYVYLVKGNSDGQTAVFQTWKFVIKPMPKPEDYTFSEKDKLVWEELAERIAILETKKEEDPTVPEWAKQAKKPSYTPQEVGADPKGTAEKVVEAHNENSRAHNDIRQLITALNEKIDKIADSDDETLDQLSEIIEYIKNNKDLIDSITTSKVNVTDIVDNLVTSVSNKPLSAKQGVVLKQMIEDLFVPTKLSELESDAEHRTVTDVERRKWNDKLSQNDLQGGINAALKQAKESKQFDGDSAYEIAVKNGYSGTEQEWVDSLKYDHSEEFTVLAEQVERDAKGAEISAANAKTSEVNSEAWSKKAEQAASRGGYMTFEIDENGDLIYTKTPNAELQFKLVNGELVIYE